MTDGSTQEEHFWISYLWINSNTNQFQRTVHSVDGEKKNTHPAGVRRLSRRITEEVFRRRMKLSKQVSNFGLEKHNFTKLFNHTSPDELIQEFQYQFCFSIDLGALDKNHNQYNMLCHYYSL